MMVMAGTDDDVQETPSLLLVQKTLVYSWKSMTQSAISF
jgi:hypothetical protein